MAKSENSNRKNLKKIKSGVLQRGFSLAKMALATGTKLTGHQIQELWQNDAERQSRWNQFLQGRAKSLSSELGELKGSLMKAGQMLSMYGEYFLPPEANEFLKSLYSDSPPLEFQEIEKILHEEWEPEIRAELEIDPVSIGSASIGQVHRAVIKSTGEHVAIKVQYRGVDRAIESDLKAIRAFLSMLKLLPRDLPMDPVFDEVRSMLQQEMDYGLEADATEAYAKRLAGDSRFVIPRVFRRYCRRKILVTSLEAGLPPDHPAVLGLSLQRRNQIAENFLDLYMLEFFQWGVVQTDPHLGNYKIRLQPENSGLPDQLVLLDFGAVRAYAPEFLSAYKRMIFHALDDKRAEFEIAATELKFLSGSEGPQAREHFYKICRLIVEPFQGGIFDYRSSDLPKRTTAEAFQLIRGFKIDPPPQEVVFLDRKTAGVFIMMVVLGARFDPRPHLIQHRPKAGL